MRGLSGVEPCREHRGLAAPSKDGVPLACIREENLCVSLASADADDLTGLRIGDGVRSGSEQSHAFGCLDSGSPLAQRNRTLVCPLNMEVVSHDVRSDAMGRREWLPAHAP